ncbi:MAG TPA: lysylphosphatidylglycerol synthase transmembrane domain-containing protein [Gemmatimonadales bacterium]|nr:lysylphosphatidylglycerol synthase transmembrane domain-containing protein [Gemmatimonadales bacterium]
MASVLTPRVLLRGFFVFVGISILGYVGVLIYGDNLPAFIEAAGHIHWQWVLVGLGLASMDWFGGGLRNWVLVRHVHPNPPVGGMILSGGMGAWAAYLTPLNSGAGPMMIYAMRRAGVPLPVAVTTTLMSFIATVLFFALAGPLAIAFGAGKSLGHHGNVLGLTLYDLFIGSLGLFVGIGVVLVIVIVFPGLARDGLHKLAVRLSKRSTRVADRIEGLTRGIDEAHQSVLAFNSPRGWLALLWATILSGPSHANKLLAGYVALRAVGIHAHFVDVLLVQTLITFLLYFAPTPGASGIAELLSTAVMSSVYLPRELGPLYTLIWRSILSYFTLAFGFVVFSRWVHGRFKQQRGLDEEDPGPEAAEAAS